ncbi:DUF3159 domain-containing protein [Catellatospora sp. KI3]|uniref:DUF3159 domain-containing protein n=1 Tax=Catellatospora sp. KI3 TaxID=3041620 RepID=UPI0024832809|nr:DUF3159 domain-containing protein [Catellatospora sp. KI3]MDI1464948.1 DUF3159 domain-containing protein [Catellatospora sp. KI3]
MSERDRAQVGTDEQEQELPPFAVQMSQQLGGWRGLFESSIPVIVFVLTNVVLGLKWPTGQTALKWAVGVAVATALGIAIVRLSQRRPIRHAVNGLFGIALGAALAWNSGEARDFYLPGILWTVAYGLAMLVSIVFRQPLVGWLWTVVANGGLSDWREDRRMVRTFSWLTGLWAAIYLLKAAVQTLLYLADQATALGVARIVLGYPPYALLLAVSIWAVRRVRRDPADPVLSA